MIFITGATGSIGSELCRLLGEAKIPARAMCRKDEQIVYLQSLGVEAMLADFDDVASLQAAMLGCSKMFLLTSPDEQHEQREHAIIDTAMAAGIRHIVRISTGNANLSAKLAYSRSHAAIDHYLRSQPVHWTILRPTGFMQNFIESGHAISKGILPHLIAEGQISYIDLRDIALTAKHALTEDGYIGATYFLTGPESLTVNQVAAQLTTVLGFDIRAVDVTEAEMRTALGYSGMDGWHIDALINQFAIGAAGGEPDVTGEVARITKHPPRTFAQFVQDYKSQFLNH